MPLDWGVQSLVDRSLELRAARQLHSWVYRGSR
jgi:hypothetical protein